MSARMRIVALLPLLLAVEVRAEDLRAVAEAGARAVFERNLAAIEARDQVAYLECYANSERLVRNGFGGVQLGYDGLASGVGEGWPDRFEAYDLKVFALTDDVVYGQYRYRVTYGEDVQEGISERVFVHTDSGWRIAVTTAFTAPNGELPELVPPPDDVENR